MKAFAVRKKGTEKWYWANMDKDWDIYEKDVPNVIYESRPNVALYGYPEDAELVKLEIIIA